ncbi:unnamed protein product, partial [marine sediment metagenome]
MPTQLEDFTVVTADYVPHPDSTRNLGSYDNSFKDCYLDGVLYTDTITEISAGSGVTIEGVLLKDSDIHITDSNYLYFGTENDISMKWDGTDFHFDVTGATAQVNVAA